MEDLHVDANDLAFCRLWIFNCISRYQVRTSFDVLPSSTYFKASNRPHEEQAVPFHFAEHLCMFVHVYGLIALLKS